MEAEENNEKCGDKDFLLLLAKRRKLLDLREDLLYRRQRQVDEGKKNLDSDDPDSPKSSVTQVSITPPPFSPLTPLVAKTINNQGRKEFHVSNQDTPEFNLQSSPFSVHEIKNNNEMEVQCETNPHTTLSHILNDVNINSSISTPLLLKNIDEPLSSPIPPMSPETQKLFKVLTETDPIFDSTNASDVIENSDISDQNDDCDDDSVADPDFDISLEKESETDCESYDDNEDNILKQETNNKGEIKCLGKKQKKDNKAINKTAHKNGTQHKGQHKNPEVLSKKHSKKTEKENLESTATPKKRPRNEDNLSLTSKNKKVMDLLKITPEKETINDKRTTSDLPPDNEYKTLKMTPKKSSVCGDNVVDTVTNLEVLQIFPITPEKKIANNKERTTIASPKSDDKEKVHESNISRYDEHETPKTTPNKSSGYQEKGSPVIIDFKGLEILTLTPEKEINNEENGNVTPHNGQDETLILKPVTRTIVEKNSNLIPTVQILELGSMSPENELNNEENVSEASFNDEDKILISTPVTTTRVEGNHNQSIQILEIESMSRDNVAETNTIGNNVEVAATSGLNTGRPKKGRKRKHPQNNSERKFNKYNNLQYTTLHKQKEIEPKEFVAFECKCQKKCHNMISQQTRKQEFEKFVKLGSYNAQLIYIASCVKEEKKKRSYTMTSVPAHKKKPKQFHRTYTIKGVNVCRDMFLKTFQITTQRVTITLKKMRKNSLDDGRGLNRSGWKKLPEDHFNFIVEVISKLPKYESHYRREKSNNALYLEPGMTVTKIYEIYKEKFAEKFGSEKKCASIGCVRKIFLTKFNLRCKSLKKDTCNKCDFFAIQLQNAKSSTEKEQIEAEKIAHLEKAETMRNQMKSDFKNARENENIECLTFDLEKTLPLPRIPTNVVFYKRQLWFYNSGIHSASDDVGHCYVWVEGEAGRGAQEVGSCLVKYIGTKLRHTAESLILWSDCCGGQNRNIKIVLMLKAILNTHPTLKRISFRYLESGHTFLPNDTDFSKIETALKGQQRVYTAEEYIKIIRNAKKKNPFQVYKMEKTDFYSTETIEKKITNRKKYTDKTKVNWLQAKEIKIQKEKPFSIFMRSSFEDNFSELNIKKNSKGDGAEIDKSDFIPLWPNGKAIAPAKLADLQSLYKYIPSDCIQFYKQLKASDDIIDDVDGFGGETDFVPDFED